MGLLPDGYPRTAATVACGDARPLWLATMTSAADPQTRPGLRVSSTNTQTFLSTVVTSFWDLNWTRVNVSPVWGDPSTDPRRLGLGRQAFEVPERVYFTTLCERTSAKPFWYASAGSFADHIEGIYPVVLSRPPQMSLFRCIRSPLNG